MGGDLEVRLSTMAIGNITKLPYVGTPANEIVRSQEVYVTAIPDPIPKPDVIPLWIFVLAACAGALILLLLILLLYKVNFININENFINNFLLFSVVSSKEIDLKDHLMKDSRLIGMEMVSTVMNISKEIVVIFMRKI